MYGDSPSTFPAVLVYALMTSGGMIGLVASMVSGVLAAVLALLGGVTSDLVVLLVGLGAATVVFLALTGVTMRHVPRAQERLGVAFPAEAERSDRPSSTGDEPLA